MAELNIPRAHSNSWYDHLATLQQGYFYPWHSVIGNRNGEQAFLELIADYGGNSVNVLEIACGHGEMTLTIADQYGHITAYDRVPEYIDLANQAKTIRSVSNVDFRCYDADQGRSDHLAGRNGLN